MIRSGPQRASSTNASGFSLLEVLVATVLSALVLVVLLSGVQTGFKAEERIGRTVSGSDDVRFAQDYLRRTLSGSISMLDRSAIDTAPQLNFDGDAQAVSWVAPAPLSISRGGLARYQVEIGADTQGTALLVKILNMDADVEDDPVNAFPLIRGFETARLSFLGEGRTWRDDWTKRHRPPDLIRIEITFADRDGRQWPPLIVAPGNDVDAGCRYDPATNYCRGRR